MRSRFRYESKTRVRSLLPSIARMKHKWELERILTATICVEGLRQSVVAFAIEFALCAGALRFLGTMAITVTQRTFHAQVALPWLKDFLRMPYRRQARFRSSGTASLRSWVSRTPEILYTMGVGTAISGQVLCHRTNPGLHSCCLR